MTEPADREHPALPGSSATHSMRRTMPRVVRTLPWLMPSAHSLTLLARTGSSAWSQLRWDPGLLLLLLRASQCSRSTVPFPDAVVNDEKALSCALSCLTGSPSGRFDWNDPVPRRLLIGAHQVAHYAQLLAEQAGTVDPDRAWSAGMLSFTGWFVLASIDTPSVHLCLEELRAGVEPHAAFQRHLGMEPVAVTRRLANLWELPSWLTGAIAHLELPLRSVHHFNIDTDLFCVVRLALLRHHMDGHDFGLVFPDVSAETAYLGITHSDIERLSAPPPATLPHWVDPYTQTILPDLLSLAIEHRREQHSYNGVNLENQIDQMHRALREQAQAEGDRLRNAKLSALAEFAAGAGHEINNPLAVISGEAQYILSRSAGWLTTEGEPVVGKALHSIINQTRRIHSILRELMLFARPAPARPTWFDLPTLIGEVASSVEDLAVAKQVKIEQICPDRMAVFADSEQVRTALTCLVRNGIEAAGADGWTRIRLEIPPANEVLDVYVEDSGPGPSNDQQPHLFDPFFSGRSAGRGKGMGLPIAWRLARQQGGDIHLQPRQGDQPTRFVFRLPRQQPPADEESQSAGSENRHAA